MVFEGEEGTETAGERNGFRDQGFAKSLNCLAVRGRGAVSIYSRRRHC